MAKRDAPLGAQMILAWRLTWEETWVHDAKIDIYVVSGVVQVYGTWWLGFHPLDLGIDKEEKEEVTASKGSTKDDPYQVNNLMHDILMEEAKVA